MKKNVTVTYLETTHPPERSSEIHDADEFKVSRSEIVCPELNRFMYASVGGDWNWTDRLSWSYADWIQCLSSDGYETWIGYFKGTPAGYFELRPCDNGEVEIAYFGLLPQFIGKRLGRKLFTSALQRAWETATSRVWLHTCTEDHPRALDFYQKMGLVIYNTKTSEVDLPPHPPGPWPNAERPFMKGQE